MSSGARRRSSTRSYRNRCEYMNRYGSKRSPDGMTLVETIIYTTLLSFLMVGIIGFLYSERLRNASLLDDIEYEQQFHR